MILIDVADQALAGDAKKFCCVRHIESGLGQGLDDEFACECFTREPEVIAPEGKIQGIFRTAGGAFEGCEQEGEIEGFVENFKGTLPHKLRFLPFHITGAENDRDFRVFAPNDLQDIFAVQVGHAVIQEDAADIVLGQEGNTLPGIRAGQDLIAMLREAVLHNLQVVHIVIHSQYLGRRYSHLCNECWLSNSTASIPDAFLYYEVPGSLLGRELSFNNLYISINSNILL